MQSEQSKECSVFSYHKTWSNLDKPVSYQMKLSNESNDMRYDVIVIHNHNQTELYTRYDMPQHNYNRYH